MVEIKKKQVSQKDIEAEDAKLASLLEEKKKLSEEYSSMLEEEKKELEKFRSDLEFKKSQEKLRKDGKLVKIARFTFHYQEQPGGTLPFTRQGIRYELIDGKEYTYLKEIPDHINTLTYPDRALIKKPGEEQATLQIIGTIPRCTATILEVIEREYNEATDIPDQTKWRGKASFSVI